MAVPVPVFDTLTDSVQFVRANSNNYLRALVFPALLVLLIQGAGVFYMDDPTPMFLLIYFPLSIFAQIMIVNVGYRIALTGKAGHVFWRKPELLTFLKTIGIVSFVYLLGFLMLIPIVLVAALIAAVADGMGIGNFAETIHFIVMCGVAGVIIAYPYLFSRFALVFPATAVAEKFSFRASYKATKGNGWRICMLASIPVLMSAIVGIPVFFMNTIVVFLTTPLYVALHIFVTLVWITAIARVYENREDFLESHTPEAG